MRGCRFLVCAALACLLAVIPGCMDVEPDAAETPLIFDRAASRDVGSMLQMPDYATGCEVVSLINALHAFGVSMDFDEAFALFDKSGSDFVNAWWGDPYGGGGAAYPPAMEAAANRALLGTPYRAEDVTGCGLQGIADCIQSGGIAIAWTTTDMQPPVWSGWEVDGWPMYANEHCVVLCGSAGGVVRVMDPLHGFVTVDEGSFRDVWEACGSMAVCIR